MKFLNQILSVLILFLLTNTLLQSAEIQFQNMTPYTTKLYGDIKVIGNTSLQLETTKNINDNDWFLSDDQASWGRNVLNGALQDIWIGAVADVSTYEANNFAFLVYNDVDEDNSTYNSSSSTLTLASGSEILYARLYWSGMIHNFADGNSIDTQKENAHTVRMKINDGSYIDVTVSVADAYNATEGWTDLFTEAGDLQYSRYSGYKDVTDSFTGLVFDANTTTTITVADLVSNEGWMRNYGNYGAWSLAVVYKNSNETFKSVNLYTGYEEVYNESLLIPIDGFLTPKTSSVVSTLSVFSVEGEKTEDFGNDFLKVHDKAGTAFDVSDNTVYPNKSSNMFDSTITNTETKNPSITNTMGIDIDTFSIGKDGDLSHPQIIDNLQTQTTIELSSVGDAYTVNAIALSTELYTPTFCYDYAYKQNNRYFTEDNDGSKDPELVGSVTTGVPVDVTLFIRSLVDSDISIDNMIVNVTDINTSQATYIDGTTTLAKIGNLTPQTVAVTSAPDYIKDIGIGTLITNDYFYINYQLNPIKSDINMSINVTAEYSLTIASTSIDYTLTLGKEIQMCSAQNFKYTPTEGLFNIVHNNYYNNTTKYYNLPTQVINRAGDFSIIALDANVSDTLKAQSTIVAIEAIDASAFHNTDASCFETSNYITDREWVIFNDESIIDVTTAYDYFKEVRENTAFRVSFNLTDDGNDDLVNTELQGDGTYKIINLSALIPDNTSTCNNSGLNARSECGDGNNISEAQLKTCMECIYALNIKLVCSRDNFSIRPEAFLIKLNDQNQTDISVKKRIADNISGVLSPSSAVVNLSAGYDYNLEVNATSYTDNKSTTGYTKSYGLSANDIFEYTWEPRSGTPTGCNDTQNKTANTKFVDGLVNVNTSLDQVGEYRLNILDTRWTRVDNDASYMSHHTGTYFLDSTNKDCIANSTITQASSTTNAIPLIGCNIGSNHTNNNINIVYQDYNVTFHPYNFDVTNVSASVGTNNALPTADSFIYVSDLSQDENMSFHLNGNIIATGYDNNNLSNFVDQCYAKNLGIDLNKSNINIPIAYGYKLNTYNLAGTQIRTSSADLNNTTNKVNVLSSDFPKTMNGSSSTILNLNYTRTKDNAINPQTITFNKYGVDCNNSSDCTFFADLTSTKTTHGEKTLGQTVKHYYGRTHVPRQRFIAPIGTSAVNAANALLYYEVYCDGAGCDKTLLQDNVNSTITDDPRWYVNTEHNSTFGTAGTTIQKNSTGVTTKTQPSGNHQDSTEIYYTGAKGYPYKATMLSTPSGWLIYNKYNPLSTSNEFEVEFINNANNWIGQDEAQNTTNTNAVNKTNRRSMW